MADLVRLTGRRLRLDARRNGQCHLPCDGSCWPSPSTLFAAGWTIARLLAGRLRKARASTPAIEAIAFDTFPIFDPRSLAALARKMAGDQGAIIAAQWSAQLFSYTWLETAADHYENFRTVASRALDSTAERLKISLDGSAKQALIDRYNQLEVWPDVKPVLTKLRDGGIRLRLLSNLSAATLRANMTRNGLDGYLEPPLSTDAVRHFKPSPMAYAVAVEAFGLPKSRIGFAAFVGWDAIGAAGSAIARLESIDWTSLRISST